MKRFKITGLCVVAVFAVSLIVSAGASAALPELGRCVKVERKTGEYGYPNCLKLAAGKGSYDWLPGPGALKKFEGTATLSTTLETASKVKIACSNGTFNGEFTGTKTETVTVDLINCEDVATKAKCQSNPANEGEIETPQALEGELGFIVGGEKPLVGLDLKPKSPTTTLVSYMCGKFPEVSLTGVVEGSVIAPIRKIDRMSEAFTLSYKSTMGKQIPQQFEGGAKDTLTSQLLVGVEKSTQPTVLKTGVEDPNEELLEIKAK
jgi:hypothetical protein